jgi:hypothetical protein
MSGITRIAHGWMTVLLSVMLVATPTAARDDLERPAGPVAVEEILLARPFALEQGYNSDWQKERPVVTHGFIVVLRVDPVLVMPRASRQPVLYAGRRPAEPITTGYPSGILAAVVPGPVDLRRTAIWFGAPALPEEVDGPVIQASVVEADEAGIRPLPVDRVERAMAMGGELRSLPDRSALLREARALVRPYLHEDPSRDE